MHFGADPVPDPRFPASDQWIRFWLRTLLFSSLTFKTQTKTFFLSLFSAYYLLFECTFTSFFEIKSHKEVTKGLESRFFYYFCLMIEGSGSGSRRPKNIWILRIRIPQHWFLSTVLKKWRFITQLNVYTHYHYFLQT